MAEFDNKVSLTTNNDFNGTDIILPNTKDNIEEVGKGLMEAGGNKESRDHEEALETHEVVEINKFTQKKEWIDEKIKFLENMPRIEVFAGIDALIRFSEEMPPGLPTRFELDHWLAEHETIEKQTEIFDAEDMSKLKTLTKAATQRNLSPEDTDLIELTLTTLLALDKLLHLLRDRSDLLDLLGLRLTWDEQRIVSWKERRLLIDDVKVFLTTRARWSLETYDVPTRSPTPGSRFNASISSSPHSPSPSPARRRDSAASISSDSSTTTLSPIFSRSARYKLAEALSHDAAILSGRFTSLNHTKVKAAGKTLDKLIDASRMPVPDEILDEQDRLEDKADKELETVGKFAMAIVMQWKRADEFYNDTMKDQFAAQGLLNELDNAKLQHPNPRLYSAFMTRAQALTKRLALKGDPTLPRSSFPRPMHPLFPDQVASNDFIVKTLSVELADAVKLAGQSEAAAQEYHQRVEAVKRAEGLQEHMQGILGQLSSIMDAMINGIPGSPGSREHGDSAPPDLGTEACLDPSRHEAFIVRLPSVVEDLTKFDKAAEIALREGNLVSLRLKALPGIDPGFKKQLLTAMQELEAQKDATCKIKLETLARTQRLRDVRNIWLALNDIMDALEEKRKTITQEMGCQRWNGLENQRYDSLTASGSGRPSVFSSSASSVTPAMLSSKLDALGDRLNSGFIAPYERLVSALEKPLSIHLQESYNGIIRHMGDIRGMIDLWKNILSQTQAMISIQVEACELEVKVDALTADIIAVRKGILDTDPSNGQVLSYDEYGSQIDVLQSSARSFVDTLPTRLPFVSWEMPDIARSRTAFVPQDSTSVNHSLNKLKDTLPVAIPFDLSTLDNDIRHEANVLALNITSKIQCLNKNLQYLHITHFAKSTDDAILDFTATLNTSEEALSQLRRSFDSLPLPASQELGTDTALSEKCTTIIEHYDRLAERHQKHTQICIQNVQSSSYILQNALGARDSSIHDTIIVPRVKTVDGVLNRARNLANALSKFQAEITRIKDDEEVRLMAQHERREAATKVRIQKEEEARLREEAQAQAAVRLQEEARREEAQAQEAVGLQEKARREKARQQEEARLREEAQAQEVVQLQEEGEVREEIRKQVVKVAHPNTPDEDVFGSKLVPSEATSNSATSASRARIMSLRNRLKSLGIVDLAHPQGGSVSSLPTFREVGEIETTFSQLNMEALSLQATIKDSIVESELRSFRADLEASHTLVEHLAHLARTLDQVTACDNAFSDLLEHIDLYPSAPTAQSLASSHLSETHLPFEEQLKSRLTFSKKLLEGMNHTCLVVADDPRVLSEQARLQQTWTELFAMCVDRLNGDRSRSASTVSSSGISTGTPGSTLNARQTKPSLGGHSPRRISRESFTPRSTSSAASMPRPGTNLSNRSVSGPSSSLFNTTYASRQRTTSLASLSSSSISPFKRPISPNTRLHPSAKRATSPTFSETSNRSLASTPSRSTWARAPRQSFGDLPHNCRQSFGELSRIFPSHRFTEKRKTYVANPKSKLDVAVGQVINNFRLPVTIQVAEDGWKDQSGRYWIGDADPKLCFCRILRSQTVMVRVGGGWCELSKFLKGHFADLLAELPPSPPRNEERWISSSIIRETMISPSSTVQCLSTPESKTQTSLPSLQVSTPNGTSPQSIKTTSSPGGESPGLTPLQYLRRADIGLRPITPLPKTPRSKASFSPNAIITPSRTSIWRP